MKPDKLIPQDIKDIEHALRRGEPLSGVLQSGGRINIERPQPFLCIYQRPEKTENFTTEALITSQSSYLIETADSINRPPVRGLVDSILAILSKSFSNVLLLEIWTSDCDAPVSDTKAESARITLHAARHNAPVDTLNELDRALISSRWAASEAPEIEISYDNATGAHRAPGLATGILENDLNITVIGLEISPYFVHRKSAQILPMVFAELRRNLSHAIKQAVFTFIESKTSYPLAHYHELGPSRLETIDLEVDERLADIDDRIDLLLNVTPVNVSEQWEQFKASGFNQIPEFHYRALQHDPSELKRQLFSIPVESVDDPALHQMFTNKRYELDQQISMLIDRDTKNFILESQQVYDCPDKNLLLAAKRILQDLSAENNSLDSSEFIDAMTFAEFARCEIDHYRKTSSTLAARVEIRQDVPGLIVSHGNFLIGDGVSVHKQRIEATLQHEVGTHVLTYHNGNQQPLKLLKTGLAGYEALQEGIAVLSEYLVGGLSRSRLRQIAARVVVVEQMSSGADFLEVFRTLHKKYRFNDLAAYNITMRVFRGGGFTKDAVYLRGLIDVFRYLVDGGELKTLLVGKIALADTEIITELLWRKILQPPDLLPRYMSISQVIERLAKISSSDDTIATIIGGIE